MPATGSVPGETALGFAPTEFELLEPLTEGFHLQFTCNLTLGETLTPLSTGTAKLNQIVFIVIIIII